MSKLKIISLNVRGLGSSSKSRKIIQELNYSNCDIILLQETHVSCKKQAEEFEILWRGKCLWSFGTGRSAGVAILFSLNFPGKTIRFLTDSEGRILSLLIDYYNSKLNLVNIYSPNTISDRKSFFSCLHNYFLPQGDLVIGGDFNCVDNVLDKLNCSAILLSDQKLLRSLCADFSLTDIWRKNNPRKVTFTWSNKDHTQASRIDRFLVSKGLTLVTKCNILPCVYDLSDHDFVKIELTTNPSNHGPGIWKFNSSLLSDVEFKNIMSKSINNFKLKIPEFASLREWWDALKIEIRKTSISYCIRKQRTANAKRILITKQLTHAKNALHSNRLNNPGVISDLESQLSSLISKEAEGAKVRSRAQWFEEGEKPTRYFFRLEKKRADMNSFESFFDENGVLRNSQNDLERILTNFYKNLFTQDPLDMRIQTEIIDGLEFSLTDYERNLCEGPFSNKELLTALEGLQTGKSPGSDGLPTEFYSCFWNDLSESLLSVLNGAFLAGSLADSQYEGLLRLIHKKDDRRLAKNWRPISLLNTDYKLASKIITERLKKVMNSIVHSDQTCGVVGRTIFSNLALLRDALDMIDKTNEPGILISLDQEKAFDRVDHEFMMRVLRKFGFGPSFCGWVELFYSKAFSRIIVNGSLSPPVHLRRGVRQGCPLSPLLYVLVSEVLSTQIRNCKDIEGFLLPGAGGLQYKISQYADDATCILKSERSLSSLLRVVSKFEQGSGAKLNTSKSEAMWLGKWRTRIESPYGLKWVTKMRVLGVYFSNGLVNVDDDNWRAKLDKLSSVLNLWKQRDLSFIGRTLVVNTLGASRLWHVAKVIPPPRWVHDSFKSIIWPFIWRGKMENVSRDRCCAPPSSGGLNVVNFKAKCASLRLSVFSSLRDDFGTSKWHYLARYFLGHKLTILDPRFSFPTNSAPSSFLPSNYYRLCLDNLRTLHQKTGALPDLLTGKNLYLLLLDPVCVAPRCSGFWASAMDRPINRWAWVWRKSRLKLIENKKNDLIWLLIHRMIRVRYLLKSWGYINSDKCAICGKTETIEHCFLGCPRVVKVWDHFSPLFRALLDSPFSISPTSVYYPFSLDKSTTAISLSNFLKATIIYWCWLARNKATFEGSLLSSNAIIDLIKKDVQLRILSNDTDTLRNFWSFKNVLCSVDAGKPIFFPSLAPP